jgi:hypothetical protein
MATLSPTIYIAPNKGTGKLIRTLLVQCTAVISDQAKVPSLVDMTQKARFVTL